MRAVVEPLEGNKVKLSVEVDEQEFERAVEAAFRKIAREVRIPGFRPGKAPRKLIEARIGAEAAREEALRDALPEYYAKALADTDVDAIAPPEIDITSGKDSGPIAFDAVVEVRPQVAVPGYGGLKVTVPSPAPTDAEIDAQVDRLRNQFAELNTVNRPAREGDHVSIDLKGYRHDEAIEGLNADDYLYEIGSGALVKEVDEKLTGARVGDILKFNADIPGAGEVTLQILVKDVKEKMLPEVTDDWASEASEFESVAELRDDIRTRLSTIKRIQAHLAFRDEVVGALVELVEEDIPEALVGAEMQQRLHSLGHRLEEQRADLAQYLAATGESQEQFVERLRADATRAVKAELALRAVADAEDLQVGADELDAEIGRLAEQLGEKPAKLRQQLERADQIPAVRSDLRKAKALEWLLENAEVVDEEGQPIDRADLTPVAPEQAVDPVVTTESDPAPEPVSQ